MKIFGGYGQFYDQMKLNLADQFVRWAILATVLLRVGYSKHKLDRAGI